MPTAPNEVVELSRGLTEKSSSKRRSAAKQLRKLGHPDSCRPLEAALRHEVRDPRTWETQYQMVMALGESSCRDALPLLHELKGHALAPMVLVAVGDAIVRLERTSEQDAKPVLALLATNNVPLSCGALRASAMLRLKFSDASIEAVLAFASRPGNEQARLWVAAAAPGWSGAAVDAFLKSCLTSQEHADTKRAAEAALNKKYLKWSPL